MAHVDEYPGAGKALEASADEFISITAGNGADTDLARLPKRIIVTITTAGGIVTIKDKNLVASTLTLPLGAWEINVRPRRVVTVTNATVICCY
jgi:hypothetical protein